MTLQELVNNNQKSFWDIAQIIWEMSYEDDIIFNKTSGLSCDAIKNRLVSFMWKLVDKNIQNQGDCVIFVLPQMSTDFKSTDEEYLSFSCNKDEINNVMGSDFTMWKGTENRLEHYAYDFDELDEVLSYDCFADNVSDEMMLAVIIDELTTFGFDEESRNNRIEEIKSDIQKGLEEIDEEDEERKGYVEFENVMDNLEKTILDNSSEKEKEEIIKKREERKEHKDRNYEYMSIALRINHKACISAVEKYYLSMMQ